jgi:hypothetical protein|tara:strand:+ start:859 stop:2001 length:1143 start_codon:yes stop_codon:yes gene_type:complete
MRILNKKGAEKLFSIWWFFVLAIVGGGITIGVLMHYSADIDVRYLESDILHDKINDCLVNQGFLINGLITKTVDIFNKCNLEKSLFEEEGDFYFKIEISDKDNKQIFSNDEKQVFTEEKDVGLTNGEEIDKKFSDLDRVKKAIKEKNSACAPYADRIVESSNKYGIDSLLILSLMMQESNCKKDASSESQIFGFEQGASYGLMQINGKNECGKHGLDSDKEKCKNELFNNPELNIEIGVKILKSKYNDFGGKVTEEKLLSCEKCCHDSNYIKKYASYTGDSLALRGYNGWGCGKNADTNFVENVRGRYNELGGSILTSNFETECKIQEENEDGEKIEAKYFPKCTIKKENILYYESNEIKKGVIKIITASNQEGEKFMIK